jgi:hypothetical protein
MEHIVKNNLYNPTFTFVECNGAESDLSSCTVKFILKKRKTDNDENALLAKEYVNPDTNILQFEFTAPETAGLPVGEAVGAIKIYRTGDKNEEVWSSEYVIEEGVFNG